MKRKKSQGSLNELLKIERIKNMHNKKERSKNECLNM